MSQVIRVQEFKNVDALVAAIVDMLKSKNVFCFRGELGAGKTTYIKSICRALGVKEEMTSPSFSIVNEYNTDSGEAIYHFDLYRLKNEDELFDIGWYDYLNARNPMFVEWPEKAPDAIPDDAVNICIEIDPDLTRTITIQNHES